MTSITKILANISRAWKRNLETKTVNTRFCEKPHECPQCGNSPVATILYGFPSSTGKLEKGLKEGRIALGGCIVSTEDPTWACGKCGLKMYEEPTNI
jgi:ribosomal protein S27AE